MLSRAPLPLCLRCQCSGTLAGSWASNGAADANSDAGMPLAAAKPGIVAFGNDVGAGRTITARRGRTWTFVPLKGEFTVLGKESDYVWNVPDWLYAMNGRPPAQESVRNGLGKYVVVLRNNYVVHSPPPPESPLQGPKPGSFMVPEADLAAIWPRISTETRVYIF